MLKDKRADPAVFNKAFICAAYHSNAQAFKLLLKHPAADPNILDGENRTPLMNIIAHYNNQICAESGAYIVLQLLDDKRTDQDVIDIHGNTALSLAQQLKHEKIISYFQLAAKAKKASLLKRSLEQEIASLKKSSAMLRDCVGVTAIILIIYYMPLLQDIFLA